MNSNTGLVNGQKLKIIKLYRYSILAKIIDGGYSGNIVFLPRITLTPNNNEVPFAMSRRQFRLAYAQTINRCHKAKRMTMPE